MRLADVRPGRYKLRSDVVDVTDIEPGKTERSATVVYLMVEKN